MREVLGSIPRTALLKHVVALQQTFIQLFDVVLQSLRGWNDLRNSEHGQTSNSVLCNVCKSNNHVGQEVDLLEEFCHWLVRLGAKFDMH